MKDESIDLLKNLAELEGVSGFEGDVRSFIRGQLEDYAEIEKDNLGNLLCKKAGTSDSPRLMIPAHMDEIGFMVKDIDENGYLKFAPLGGWLDHVLLGHMVKVKTRKGDLEGVIGCKPPHLMSASERKKLIRRKKMFIDVGADDREDAEENLGVRVGDPVVPIQTFSKMTNEKYLLCKAWDDRVGCGLMIDLVKELADTDHPNTVFGVGTVQEEVGARGAETAADAVEPDLCIALDVSVATDVPGIENERKMELGKGPIVSIRDAGTIGHHKFTQFLIDLAEEKGIPCQRNVVEGGATDAKAIHLHGKGVPSVLLGVPTRYIHSHAGIIHTDDYEATLKLLKEVAETVGPEEAAEFTA